MLYLGVIALNEHGVYDVDFPDLPGCYSQGANVEEAIKNGQEALDLHVEGMLEEGIAFPHPSDDAAVIQSYHMRQNVIFQRFAPNMPEAQTKEDPVRLSVSLKPSVVASIDRAACEMGLSRSGLIAVAARHYINSMRG